jgi:hypothetical protein
MNLPIDKDVRISFVFWGLQGGCDMAFFFGDGDLSGDVAEAFGFNVNMSVASASVVRASSWLFPGGFTGPWDWDLDRWWVV